MISRAGEFVPFGAPGSPIPRLDARQLLLESVRTAPTPEDGLADAVQRSFGLALLDALRRAARADAGGAGDRAAATVPTPPPSPVVPPPAPEIGLTRQAPPPAPAEPADEGAVIGAAARRAGVDARFLEALRRTENGGPGREFGVLSVPAPTYEDQARVAAESVRRSIERFERTGRPAIDPATGRYTEEFIRFFSARWAPINADNDPVGLNRHHARNLIRLYARVSGPAG